MIIGISGGTGSGKTTVANRILESVSASEVVFIQQDSYYRNLKDLTLDYRQVANFDHPDALDNDLLVNHVRKLKAGEPIDLPLYDFKTHSRLIETRGVEPKPIVIVEGILIFAEPRLLEQMDIKVLSTRPTIFGLFAGCVVISQSVVVQSNPSSNNTLQLCALCICNLSNVETTCGRNYS
jgi:uridine kinase